MDIKILIATHKKYWMPADDMYLPIHVGKMGKDSLGYIGDDTKYNISEKNSNYCELTAVYWGWKNLKNNYIGLTHYRRHFSIKKYILKEKKKYILKQKELEVILKNIDIVLPNKRKYYIETIRSHYNHTHNGADMDMTEEIIKELYPEYLKAFNKVMNRNWAHMFNMFIMKKTYYDEYCEWLFSILGELECRLHRKKLMLEPRLYGYISEPLLDVWIETKKIKYKETNWVFLENQNWLKKGMKFLSNKLLNGRNFTNI